MESDHKSDELIKSDGRIKSEGLINKEVFSEKSCFKNFADPLSEEENIKK